MVYRVTQFARALTDRASQEEIADAIRGLEPQAQRVFWQQSRQDQCHALAVARSLQRRGYSNPTLLEAALLHDAGKSAAHLTPWHRAAIVALERLAPTVLTRLSQDAGANGGCALPGWRLPFVVHAQHPELGARLARQAGCSALAVALIRRHQDQAAHSVADETEEDQLLAALQAADNAA
ncbi:MAG: hypothetical protein GX601_01885 [Anaerolineales bacterium]|nr:hypothetical protein [Anaerolineales bacterium]